MWLRNLLCQDLLTFCDSSTSVVNCNPKLATFLGSDFTYKASRRARHHIKRAAKTNKTKHKNTETDQRPEGIIQRPYTTYWVNTWQEFKNINHISGMVWKVPSLFSMAVASSSFATNEQPANRRWALIGAEAQKDARRELWEAPRLVLHSQ